MQAEAEAEQLGAAFEALAEAALAADGNRTAEGLPAAAAAETSAAEQTDTKGSASQPPPAAAAAAAGGSCGVEGTRTAESRVELLQRADAAEQVGVWLMMVSVTAVSLMFVAVCACSVLRSAASCRLCVHAALSGRGHSCRLHTSPIGTAGSLWDAQAQLGPPGTVWDLHLHKACCSLC